MGHGVCLLIVAELHEGVQLMPRFGVVRAEDPEVNFEFLIYSFSFSVGLGMVSGTSECFYSKKSHDFAEYLGGELWASVGEEGVGEAKAFEHVFDVIQGRLGGVNCLVTRDRDYPLSRSVVDNDHEAVISVANREICDEIACYLRKWSGIPLSFDQYQTRRGQMCVNFHLLADSATGDIIFDENRHPRPPVISADEFEGFKMSGVSSSEGIVVTAGDFVS